MKKDTSFICAIIFFICIGFLVGCGVPGNYLSLQKRSMIIDSKEREKEILAKATIERSNDPAVNNISVLHLKGTPYEMGFQHGRLLKKEIREIVHHVIGTAMLMVSEDMMDGPGQSR